MHVIYNLVLNYKSKFKCFTILKFQSMVNLIIQFEISLFKLTESIKILINIKRMKLIFKNNLKLFTIKKKSKHSLYR